MVGAEDRESPAFGLHRVVSVNKCRQPRGIDEVAVSQVDEDQGVLCRTIQRLGQPVGNGEIELPDDLDRPATATRLCLSQLKGRLQR